MILGNVRRNNAKLFKLTWCSSVGDLLLNAATGLQRSLAVDMPAGAPSSGQKAVIDDLPVPSASVNLSNWAGFCRILHFIPTTVYLFSSLNRFRRWRSRNRRPSPSEPVR